jgi:hypothetical protein
MKSTNVNIEIKKDEVIILEPEGLGINQKFLTPQTPKKPEPKQGIKSPIGRFMVGIWTIYSRIIILQNPLFYFFLGYSALFVFNFQITQWWVGSDSFPFFYDSSYYWSKYNQIWSASEGFGSLALSASLFISLPFALISQLLINIFGGLLAQFIVNYIFYGLMIVGVWNLTGLITKSNKIRTGATLFYSLHFLTWYVLQRNLWFLSCLAVFTPWLIYLINQWIVSGKKRYLLYLLGISIFNASIFTNPGYTLPQALILITFIPLYLGSFLAYNRPISSSSLVTIGLKNRIKTLWLRALDLARLDDKNILKPLFFRIVTAFTIIWIFWVIIFVPQYIFLTKNESLVNDDWNNVTLAIKPLEDQKKYSVLSNSLRGYNPDLFISYGYEDGKEFLPFPGHDLYNTFLIEIVSWIPVFLLISGILFSYLNKIRLGKTFYWFVVVFVATWFIFKSAAWPFGQWFEWAQTNIKLFKMFRAPHQKFGISFVIVQMTLLAILFDKIDRSSIRPSLVKIDQNSFKFVYNLKKILNLGVYLLICYSLLMGGMYFGGQARPKTMQPTNIPAEYKEVASYLNNDSSVNSVFLLPFFQSTWTVTNFGYEGYPLLMYLLPTKQFYNRNSIAFSEYNKLLQNAGQKISTQDRSGVEELERYHTDVIVFDKNTDNSDRFNVDDQIEKNFEWLKRQNEYYLDTNFGNQFVFKLKSELRKPLIFGNNVSSFEKKSESEYIIHIQNLKDITEIIMLQGYHSGWKLHPVGDGRAELFENTHSLLQGYAQNWTMDSATIEKYLQSSQYEKTDGGINIDLRLAFQPQLELEVLWGVAGGFVEIVLLLILAYLINSKNRKDFLKVVAGTLVLSMLIGFYAYRHSQIGQSIYKPKVLSSLPNLDYIKNKDASNLELFQPFSKNLTIPVDRSDEGVYSVNYTSGKSNKFKLKTKLDDDLTIELKVAKNDSDSFDLTFVLPDSEFDLNKETYKTPEKKLFSIFNVSSGNFLQRKNGELINISSEFESVFLQYGELRKSELKILQPTEQINSTFDIKSCLQNKVNNTIGINFGNCIQYEIALNKKLDEAAIISIDQPVLKNKEAFVHINSSAYIAKELSKNLPSATNAVQINKLDDPSNIFRKLLSDNIAQDTIIVNMFSDILDLSDINNRIQKMNIQNFVSTEPKILDWSNPNSEILQKNSADSLTESDLNAIIENSSNYSADKSILDLEVVAELNPGQNIIKYVDESSNVLEGDNASFEKGLWQSVVTDCNKEYPGTGLFTQALYGQQDNLKNTLELTASGHIGCVARKFYLNQKIRGDKDYTFNINYDPKSSIGGLYLEYFDKNNYIGKYVRPLDKKTSDNLFTKGMPSDFANSDALTVFLYAIPGYDSVDQSIVRYWDVKVTPTGLKNYNKLIFENSFEITDEGPATKVEDIGGNFDNWIITDVKKPKILFNTTFSPGSRLTIIKGDLRYNIEIQNMLQVSKNSAVWLLDVDDICGIRGLCTGDTQSGYSFETKLYQSN